MVMTRHSVQRALERIVGFKGEPNDKMYAYAERLLRESIKPCGYISLEGSKYYAQIDGYDNYRAVIQVSESGVHTIITIIPIKDMKW